MKPVAYIRCSSLKQAESGLGMEAQRRKLEAWAVMHDVEDMPIVVDDGETAKDMNRPGLQRCLDMLASGEADTLVVYKLGRLTRSLRDLDELIRGPFAPGRASLVSLSDSIDTQTATGRLVLNVIMAVLQWEREAICERTSQAMQAAKAQRRIVGAIPVGCMRDPDNPSFHINDPDFHDLWTDIQGSELVMGVVKVGRWAKVVEYAGHWGNGRASRPWSPKSMRRLFETAEKYGWSH